MIDSSIIQIAGPPNATISKTSVTVGATTNDSNLHAPPVRMKQLNLSYSINFS